MADLDKPNEEEVIEDVNEEVETPNSEDENLYNQEETTELESDDQEQEENSEEESNEDKPDAEEESKFQKRFTQIKGDTVEEYKTNLEEAYRNSSTEAQRIATELKSKSSELDKIQAAMAADPKLADALNQAIGDEKLSVQQKPAALEWAEKEMKTRLDAEYNEFTDAHTDMVTDETLREEVLNELSIIADIYAAKGKSLGMKEGLEKAWRNLGYDEADSKEATVQSAKNIANKPATAGKSKPTQAKNGLTDAQIEYAKRYGVSADDLAANNK